MYVTLCNIDVKCEEDEVIIFKGRPPFPKSSSCIVVSRFVNESLNLVNPKI